MRRTQIYITDEQAARIAELAEFRRVSKAEVIRGILDEALEVGDAETEASAGIRTTAGSMPDAPDWQEWQESVRGKSADGRLKNFGL